MGRRKRTYRFGGGGVTPVMAEVLELPPVVHLLTVFPEANPSPTPMPTSEESNAGHVGGVDIRGWV